MTEQVWTGALNDDVRIGGRVGLYDTTLRDGEQTVGVVLDPEQKLEIARLLDELGVDRIEAGFPRVSPEDRRAVELIQGAGLKAEIWGFSRALRADVDALIELDVRAAVIEAPVSEGKLRALLLDHEEVLRRIDDAVSHAVAHDMTIAFFGVDGTRADLTFLETAYRTARQAGAQEAVVVDTIGVAAPEAAGRLVSRVREWVSPDVPVHWHGHNDFGLATAGAVSAVRAGATWVHGTINGMGERAGNANLGEVAMALHALYGTDTNLRLEQAARGLAPRAGALRLRARALEAGHRREPVHARERRGREPVPRSAGDRALRRRPRRRRPEDRARQEERRGQHPDQVRRARSRRVGGGLP